MKKTLLVLVFLLTCLYSFSQEPDSLISGNLLFLAPPEPCRVVLKGTELGMTPLLVKDAVAGTLQLFGKDTYYQTELLIDNKKNNVTFFTPETVPYYGWLNLPNIKLGSSISINGGQPVEISSTKLIIPEGVHDFTITNKACMPFSFSLEIKRLEESFMVKSQREASQVFLPDGIPLDSEIIFTSEKEKIEYLYENQDFFLLPRGKWTLTIHSSKIQKIQHLFNLDKESQNLTFDLTYFSPIIQLAGFKDKSFIIFNNQEILPQEDKLVIKGNVGENTLIVRAPGYLPIEQKIELVGNVTKNIQLDYNKDPQAVRANRKNTGWILLGSGLTILASGMIMNNDELLIENTPGYEQYRNLKYTSLGIAGTGVVSLLTGTGLILTSFGAN